jgi:HEAT repeat protein
MADWELQLEEVRLKKEAVFKATAQNASYVIECIDQTTASSNREREKAIDELAPLVQYLDKSKQEEVVVIILKLLKEDPDESVREQAARSIQLMGSEISRKPEMLDALLEAIQSNTSPEESHVRLGALNSINNIYDYENLNPGSAKEKIIHILLTSCFDDDKDLVRRMAIVTAEPFILENQALQTKIAQMRDTDHVEDVRDKARETLEERGIFNSPEIVDDSKNITTRLEAIEKFGEDLKNPDPEVRKGALTGFKELGDFGLLNIEKQEAVVDNVIDLLIDPDLRIRAKAAELIKHMGTEIRSEPKVLEALLGAIQDNTLDGGARIRYEALRSIHPDFNYPNAPDAKEKITATLLNSALKDPDPHVRSMAIAVAAPLIIENSEIKNAIQKMQGTDWDFAVITQATNALLANNVVRSSTPQNLPPALEKSIQLSHPNLGVCEQAEGLITDNAVSLVQKDPKAIQRLNDPDPTTRLLSLDIVKRPDFFEKLTVEQKERTLGIIRKLAETDPDKRVSELAGVVKQGIMKSITASPETNNAVEQMSVGINTPSTEGGTPGAGGLVNPLVTKSTKQFLR